MRTHLIHIIALTSLALVVLPGCYTELDSDDSVTTTETTPPEPEPVTSGSGAPSSGGRSTLGKAKESAKGTVRKLEDRQADIEKQLEDDQP